MEHLFYYMAPTPNNIWDNKANKTQQISVKTQVKL